MRKIKNSKILGNWWSNIFTFSFKQLWIFCLRNKSWRICFNKKERNILENGWKALMKLKCDFRQYDNINKYFYNFLNVSI